MHAIDIANRQTLLEVDEQFIERIVRETLRAERVAAAEISIALVDDQTIHALNKRHLDHDYPTDVLSFLFDCETEELSRVESREPEAQAADDSALALDSSLSTLDSSALDPRPSTLDPPPRGRGKRIDGEVIVSVETAIRNSTDHGFSPRDEIVLYVVHGLLHLVGYDDATNDERKLMRTRERAMLDMWQLSPGADR